MLVVDSGATKASLPVNFRTAQTPFQQTEGKAPSRVGLDALPISASGQFSASELAALIDHLQVKHLVIVDLREESHGFINDKAVSWFAKKNWGNKGKSLAEIQTSEIDWLLGMEDRKQVIISTIIEKNADGTITTAFEIPQYVQSVCTEKQLCNLHRVGYVRFPVRDHVKPSDEVLDQFLLFINELPPNTHLHFHCRKGRGRATTFMAIYDMLHNSRDVSFEEIIERQYLIGGQDLLLPPPDYYWKYPYTLERGQFVYRFYRYTKENPTSLWSQWTETTAQQEELHEKATTKTDLSP